MNKKIFTLIAGLLVSAASMAQGHYGHHRQTPPEAIYYYDGYSSQPRKINRDYYGNYYDYSTFSNYNYSTNSHRNPRYSGQAPANGYYNGYYYIDREGGRHYGNEGYRRDGSYYRSEGYRSNDGYYGDDGYYRDGRYYNGNNRRGNGGSMAQAQAQSMSRGGYRGGSMAQAQAMSNGSGSMAQAQAMSNGGGSMAQAQAQSMSMGGMSMSQSQSQSMSSSVNNYYYGY